MDWINRVHFFIPLVGLLSRSHQSSFHWTVRLWNSWLRSVFLWLTIDWSIELNRLKSNRHHFLWFLSNLLFIPALFFLKFYALQWLFSPVQSHSQLKKAAKMSQRTMHWYYNNYHFRNYTRVDSMSIWPELLASMTYFR